MNDQGLGSDLNDFGESVAECESVLEEPITIKRFTSQDQSVSARGTAKKPVFTNFEATALVVEMGAASKFIAAEMLQVGDIVLQMRDQLIEGNENIGGTTVADRVVYRGMEYRMVQRPFPQSFGGGLSGDVPFWIVHLRRTNSTTDVTGQ